MTTRLQEAYAFPCAGITQSPWRRHRCPNRDDVTTARSLSRRRGRIGWILVGSGAIGLVAGLVLALAPFVPPDGARVTGAALCGLALGWAGLAVLSRRFTEQPQTWAAVPAVVMGLGGLLLVGFGSSVDGVLSWVWPPVILAVAIWMAVQAHRHLRSRTRRWLLYPVMIGLALAAVGGGWQTVSAAVDARAYPMPGQLVDVGGHRLHLQCFGSGSPTVVLEAGAGLMSSGFGWISPAVAGSTRVCAYDRAGHGWSDPVGHAQDGGEIAGDLHELLSRGEVPGPYVLAGHSFGGLYVLAYAARYPEEVAGMVLIDTTAPASNALPPVASERDDAYSLTDRIPVLMATTTRLGIARLISQSDYGELPQPSGGEARASAAKEAHVRSTIDEYIAAGTSARQAAALTDFAAKPLVVLTAGSGKSDAASAAHDRLAALSTTSAHRVVAGVDHIGLIHNEKGAAATSQAILDVVSAVRDSA